MLEWKKLGGIANLVRGKVISKDYIRDHEGLYPVYSSQTANNGILGCIDSYMFDGDFLTWTTDGAYAGTIFRRKGKFNITNVCGLVDLTDKQVNQDFLYYWLSFVAKDYVNEGMGNPKLMSNVASTIRIPIPSMAEQTRIVGILDTFTASIENLKQQIAQRHKQYEHYRDQLLNLEGKEGVEMMRLGEITKVLRGKRLTKNLLDDNAEYPVYHGGIEPLGRYSQYNREANTVMVINVGASAGTVGFSDIRFWSSDGCFCISHSDLINNKYLYYYLETKTHYLQSQVRYAGIPTLDNLVVEKVLVPIISLQNQSRIVSILDTFEDSIANLEQQLAQRERQYEYYRNKLLTFE